jgi:hypothetical protein
VAAYYHDIGKMRNPAYYAENQPVGENKHEKLKPQMSALIIRSHIKDGLEIARAQRLGKDICDVAFQHHGTTLMTYFYNKAKQLYEGRNISADDYRYPGPKPQSREAAILMLADSVEAAAKSITDPTISRIKDMVHKIINGKFVDGQLEACELTLGDLRQIANTFIRLLTGVYHSRPEYPGQIKVRSQRVETLKNGAVRSVVKEMADKKTLDLASERLKRKHEDRPTSPSEIKSIDFTHDVPSDSSVDNSDVPSDSSVGNSFESAVIAAAADAVSTPSMERENLTSTSAEKTEPPPASSADSAGPSGEESHPDEKGSDADRHT